MPRKFVANLCIMHYLHSLAFGIVFICVFHFVCYLWQRRKRVHVLASNPAIHRLSCGASACACRIVLLTRPLAKRQNRFFAEPSGKQPAASGKVANRKQQVPSSKWQVARHLASSANFCHNTRGRASRGTCRNGHKFKALLAIKRTAYSAKSYAV